MDDGFDLDAYLERLGVEAGPADEATLGRIVRAHARAIPFEDFDIHRGVPIRLDLGSLTDKLCRRRRGGYCFEHNTLLKRALEALGFAPRAHAGRVRYLGTTLLPRTHMLLLVDLGGRTFLADVGFGGRNLREPLPFEVGVPSIQGREAYRIDREADGFVLRSVLPDGDRDLYAFGLETQHPPDFEMASWYTSTHPSSRFVKHRIAACLGEGRRVSLVDRELRIVTTGADGSEHVERRELEPGPTYLEAIREWFDIDLPADPPLRPFATPGAPHPA